MHELRSTYTQLLYRLTCNLVVCKQKHFQARILTRLSLLLPLFLSVYPPPPSLCHTPTPLPLSVTLPPPSLSLSISSPFSVCLIITSPLYSLCLPTFSSSCPPPSSPCVLPLSLHLFLQCQKIFEAIGKAFKTKVYMYLHLFH